MPGWAPADVLPSFARLERIWISARAAYHGQRRAGCRCAVTGGEQSGLTQVIAGGSRPPPASRRCADHNAPGAVGVGPLPVNCVDGRRISTALAYLEPRPAGPT